MTGDGTVTALVLAGQRAASDPVAAAFGQRFKVAVPIAGVPMLVRVVRTLLATPAIGRILLSLTDASELEDMPELDALHRAGRVEFAPAGTSPSDSVRRTLAGASTPWPMLVTTGDHPLLTRAMIEHFHKEALAGGADVAVAVATAEIVRAAYPDAARTFYRLAGEDYSGCNLFLLTTPASLRAAAFWTDLERFRKQPWRLIAAIGIAPLVQFLLGRLTLDGAMEVVSRRIGATVRAVRLPFAEASIDVDKPEDLVLAEAILRRRDDL